MKTSVVRLDWKNRRYVQDIEYGVEDGLPEGYTLFLEHTAHPEDPTETGGGTVYKDGDWGCWGYSPQTLTLIHEEKSENGSQKKETILLDAVETNCLRWIDIYDGIIVYASTGQYKNKNMVLYNVLTRQKLIIDDTFIPEDDEYDHFRNPKLWVHNNVIYVQFEAVDGWYDGGESCGSRIFCFDKDTLKQLEFKDTDDSGADVWEAIENRGEELKCANGSVKRFYHANLYPDYFHNRYGKKEITSMYHETVHKEHKYKEFPKYLIKDMKNARLAYAKEINAKIEPYKLGKTGETIWYKLSRFFDKLDYRAKQRRWKRFEKEREKGKKANGEEN